MRGAVLLVRHAQSEGNAARTFTGTTEVPLTEHGWEQARTTAAFLERNFSPVRLVTSPFERARQTASVLAERLSLEAEVDGRVRERNMGELHGKPYDRASVTRGFDTIPRHVWRPPGGETLIEVQQRAAPAVEEISTVHPEDEVIVVSHGGTIRALWSWAAGSWDIGLVLRNAGVLLLPHDGERFAPPEVIEIP